MNPLLSFIDSCLWWINKDLFSEVSNLLTLLEDIDEMDHGGLA